MKKIYLIRHSETIWNLERKTQGLNDSPLTQNGILQANVLGKVLKEYKIDIIYSSPLKRAQHTAQIINTYLSLPIFIDHGLKEINFGLWEGLSSEEIRKLFPTEMGIWRNNPEKFCSPEGESIKTAQKRIVDFLDSIILKPNENNILLISHSSIIKLLLLHILNMDLSSYYRLKNDNCSISLVEYREYGPVLVKYNDICHVEKTTR